jgi:3-(3-hydroxy-phenyl)propionate hydroxylase
MTSNRAAVIRVAVAVVGAGPVGTTAANLLGSYGIDTLLVDKEQDVVDFPRAVGVDDEALRTFQAVGLADEIMGDAIQNVPLKFFDASGRCFADIRPTAREFGWFKRNIFMQPLAEATLRRGLERYPQVRTMLGTELVDIEQDEDRVVLQLTNAQGERWIVHADYVIAADGGRSPIRTKLGIELEGATHARKWVVIDCANDPLDAPYTGLHCDPRRPYVCAHMPYDYRRWEFMLFPGEDAEQMLAPETVRDLLRHHVSDPSTIDIVRARVYTHHSRLAASFVAGRIVLAGDAAHLMPPWAGQGMNTGIRDATNLAWKLAAIVSGQADPLLLSSYEQERRQHAKAMVDLSTNLGRMLSPTHHLTARVRDLVLRAATVVPGVRSWVVEMRFKPKPYYRQGFIVSDEGSDAPRVGRMFIQPIVETATKKRVRLDEVLGSWFAVIGFECDPLSGLDESELAILDRLNARVIKIVESRPGDLHRCRPTTRTDTVLIEDADNELRSWFERTGRTVAVLRPDRYLAALTTPSELGESLRELSALLTTRSDA